MAQKWNHCCGLNPLAVFCGGAALAAAYYFLSTPTSDKIVHKHASNASTSPKSSGISTLDTLPRVVLFGDSLTERSFEPQGWGAGLQNHFARQLSVRLAGFGGYNSRWAVAMLPHIFPLQAESSKIVLTTVWFGANDAAKESERVHVPIEEYSSNLRKIIKHIKQCSVHVILITPPPVHHETRLKYQKEKYGSNATGVLERTNERAAAYAAEAERVATEEGVAALNLHKTFQQHDDLALLLCDGLHLSDNGQRLVLDAILGALSGSDPHIFGEIIPNQFPCHSKVNATCPDFRDVL